MPKIWQMFLYEGAYCQVEQAGFAEGDGGNHVSMVRLVNSYHF
jgi:hypothetical protein